MAINKRAFAVSAPPKQSVQHLPNPQPCAFMKLTGHLFVLIFHPALARPAYGATGTEPLRNGVALLWLTKR
jgi:hypothetical protein